MLCTSVQKAGIKDTPTVIIQKKMNVNKMLELAALFELSSVNSKPIKSNQSFTFSLPLPLALKFLNAFKIHTFFCLSLKRWNQPSIPGGIQKQCG